MKIFEVDYNELGEVYRDELGKEFVRKYEITHREPVNVLAEDVEQAIKILKTRLVTGEVFIDDDPRRVFDLKIKSVKPVCDVDYIPAGAVL